MVEDVRSTVSQQGPRSERTGALATLAVGTRVGKYQIAAVLGQGGFGITYRAHDLQLHRDVAVKEYLPTAFAVRDPDSMVLPRSTHVAEDFRWGRERFLAEARTLARFENATGIVSVYDFLEANGTAYMVMGLVSGETLEARLKRTGTLSQQEIEQLLNPLLEGLEQVHAAEFLHRDIKPGNILIDAKGRPTLIDFGASRAALQGRTQVLTAVYTPGYAAFEQFTSAKQGPWTDIYALGATLYHCVTGAQPPTTIERHQDDTLVPASIAGSGRYAPGLLAAIDAALRLKPAERPQNIAMWRQLLAGAPPAWPGRPPEAPTRIEMPPVARPVQRRGRWRWPVGIAAAVLVLGLAGGGYVWWLGVQEAEAWSRAVIANTEAGYQGYLAQWPQGAHAEQARKIVADLEARRDATRRADEEAWASAKAANTMPGYWAYLAAHPEGRYAADANKAIADLEADEQAWRRATAAHSKDSYREYLQNWPTGVRAAEARQAIADLDAKALAAEQRAEDEVWGRARTANTKAALQDYIDRYPQGRYAAQARGMIEALDRAEDEAWARARTTNTVASLRGYLDRYPTGRFAGEARGMLQRAEQAAAQQAEDEAWAAARAANTIPALRGYLEKYPYGRFAAEARDRIGVLERAWRPRDCPQCPEMVAVRPGSFAMGAAAGEHAREGVPAELASRELPQHTVRIGYAFSLGKYEVTRGEFATFVQATGHYTGDRCTLLGADGRWAETTGRTWRNPGFDQTDRDPVVCVSWDDAVAYTNWLSRTTGKTYRLPSEAEWEYAARADTPGARYWGDSRDSACSYGNFADQTAAAKLNWDRKPENIFMCSDEHVNTAPVGQFQANAWGLHDVLGNAWEWTRDCWNDSHAGAPGDGSPRQAGDCTRRVVRGAAWNGSPKDARAAVRLRGGTGYRHYAVGFRVARAD